MKICLAHEVLIPLQTDKLTATTKWTKLLQYTIFFTKCRHQLFTYNV